MPRSRKPKTDAKALAIVAGAFLLAALAGCAAQAHVERDGRLDASDVPYEWVFDYSQDMQYPELPNGCEAVAASTLLRMHGVTVTKQAVADAMPKSDGSDFVNAYWGDPYATTGWSCMPPCAAYTMNRFLESSGYAAFESKGASLDELPLPCLAWVTIDYEPVRWSGYEQDGYRLARNPHVIVIRKVAYDSVAVSDPLQGPREIPRDQVERAYDDMGRMAVIMREWE